MRAGLAGLTAALVPALGCGEPASKATAPMDDGRSVIAQIRGRDNWPEILGELECNYSFEDRSPTPSGVLQLHSDSTITVGDEVLLRPTSGDLGDLLIWLRRRARDMPREVIETEDPWGNKVTLTVPRGAIGLHVDPRAPFEIAGAVLALCASEAVRIGQIRLAMALADGSERELHLRQLLDFGPVSGPFERHCITIRRMTADDVPEGFHLEEYPILCFIGRRPLDMLAFRDEHSGKPREWLPDEGALLSVESAVDFESAFDALSALRPLPYVKMGLEFPWRDWELPEVTPWEDASSWGWPEPTTSSLWTRREGILRYR